LSDVVDKKTLSSTPLIRRFSLATAIATGSLSIAQIFFAPSLTKAIARIPDPVPISSAVHFEPGSNAATCSM